MTAGAGERARELADKATESILQLLREYQAYKPGPLGPYRPALSGEIYARVAGALATVRLEATASLRADCVELMAKWRAHGEAQDTRGLAFGVDGEDFRDCANDLEVALERAVEGK